MARKPQENPSLDMTPMIDVVFELIIFFVVTLTEANKKDETIELETGRNGTILTAKEVPPDHMQIDVSAITLPDNRLGDSKNPAKGKYEPRISMGDRTLSIAELREQIKLRKERYNHDFPIFIRADYEAPHSAVQKVMDVCASEGIWQLSIMAVGEDKTNGKARPFLNKKAAGVTRYSRPNRR